MNKNCIHCGNEFLAKRSTARYCSQKCNTNHIYASNKEKYIATTKAYKLKNVGAERLRNKESHRRNKKRNIETSMRWQKANPERTRSIRRNHLLKKNYGISLDQYDDILQIQDNSCAICGNKCKTGSHLAVDHCHLTNRVRGLLCSKCNRGIGMFDDDINLLSKAMKYLK